MPSPMHHAIWEAYQRMHPGPQFKPRNQLFVRRDLGLSPRDDGDDRDNHGGDFGSAFGSATTTDLLLTLLFIVLIGLFCFTVLQLYRRRRRAKKLAVSTNTLPFNTDDISPRNARGPSVFVLHEKQQLRDGSTSPPPAGVPEIHITFPEDHESKTQGSKVVVLHVGEKGELGLSAATDEQLPAYQKDSSDRFTSLDLERMGGLKEKEMQKETHA